MSGGQKQRVVSLRITQNEHYLLQDLLSNTYGEPARNLQRHMANAWIEGADIPSVEPRGGE